jgi:hypothetical protein
MLGLPLTAREWSLPALDTCKHLMASAVASAEAANRRLTKNQKKRLKKKFKKRLEQGQIIHPVPIMPMAVPLSDANCASPDLRPGSPAGTGSICASADAEATV